MKTSFTFLRTSIITFVLLLLLFAFFYFSITRKVWLPVATGEDRSTPLKFRPKQIDPSSEQQTNSGQQLRMFHDAESLSLNQMLASLEGMQSGPQYQFELKQIADLYAEINPDKGFEWLNSLPPTMESVGAFSSFFGKLGNLDPTKAMAWVEQIKFEGGQKAAASSASTIIAFNKPILGWELLNRWKSILPDRLVMQGRILQSISQSSGAEFAWNIYNPKNQNLGLADTTRFFKAVRFDSPSKALDFVSEKVSPDNQSGAMEAIVKSWLQTDLQSISEELAARPIESKYDGAYSALVRQTFVADPISAAKWSKVITDPKLKETVQTEIKNYARANDKSILNQVESVLDSK